MHFLPDITQMAFISAMVAKVYTFPHTVTLLPLSLRYGRLPYLCKIELSYLWTLKVLNIHSS